MPNDNEHQPLREDLDKDMQIPGDEYLNMEGDNRSTAAEGSLKTIEQDKNQEKNIPEEIKKDSPAPPDETKRTSLAEDESMEKDAASS
ncbi:hypothetical protein EXU57_05875 [Segetibacter sp. 3557_3]|uniref:hypothetical protein n=1 Tax=Segetibacter sp. 3557_3 TaxID=2547429 RepID=UPI001058A666|nr:hypothetical protein [Segetibacter sp. 3557_3]TDH27989.1 hypothetical protein EXU57_05875 [Segetibacter sp. 3557_3]